MNNNTKKNAASSSEAIYKTLINDIITLKLPPGELISETETSERFGVSRTPVRDAFKKLEHQNFIQILPQRHTQISPINLKNIYDLMFIREKLEVGIIEDAFENINNLQLLQVQISLYKQKELLENTNISLREKATLFLELDNEFHRTLSDIANKTSVYIAFKESLWPYQRYRTISASIHDQSDLETFYLHHCQILEALEKRNIDDIRSVYKQHIYSGTKKIPEMLSIMPNYFK